MLLPLKAIISKKVRKKDGKSIVIYQYCYSSSRRVNLQTGIAVPRRYWNAKRQCISDTLPEEYGSPEELNHELLRQRKVIERIIFDAQKEHALNLGEYVKARYSPILGLHDVILRKEETTNSNNQTEFFKEIDCFIESKRKEVSKGTIDIVKSMKAHLLAYQEKRNVLIDFSMMDYNFYCDFIDFLTYEYQLKRKKIPIYGLKTNSVGRTIKKLVWFLKDRIRRKIIPPIDLVDFKVPTEEVDAIYLSYEEIGKIYHTDLSGYPELVKDRDLFVLGCLSGLRYSDYSTLRGEDYRNGLLHKKTNKTDNWVAIPLRAPASDIFKTYFIDSITTFSFTMFNRNIKQIAALAGITEPITFKYKRGNQDVSETKSKAEWVTSHTCRRSFASNEFLLGTEVSLIMKITGHKSLREFLKYIKVSAEDGARRIEAVWLSRGNMDVFSHQKLT